MKILLINPPRVAGYPVVREERFEHKDFEMILPPLSLLYSAAILRNAGHSVSLLDANGFNFSLERVYSEIKANNPEIVITRTGFDTFEEDIKVLEIAKKRGATTIVRNRIISCVPGIRDSILKKFKFIDFFVNNELDLVIKDICRNIENNAKPQDVAFLEGEDVVVTPNTLLNIDLDSLPFPAYDLLQGFPYRTSMFSPVFTQVISSRGCPYACSFCAYAKTIYRERSPKNVIEELKWLKKDFRLKSFVFFDDTISINSERVISISRKMIQERLNLKFAVCTRVDLVTDEMLRWLRRAGCLGISFGIESGSQEILDRCGKGITVADIIKAVMLSKKNGLKVTALIILGLPGETRETVFETIGLIKKINPYYCHYAMAVPFPNTEIYKYFSENGLIISSDWKRYNPLHAQPVFRTKALDSKELSDFKIMAYKKFILRPGFIIDKINIVDMLLCFKGIRMLARRLISLFGKDKYIR